MKVLFVAALMMAVTANAIHPSHRELSSHYSFDQYVKDFHKTYTPEEYAQRKEIFEGRLKSVLLHNARGVHTYKKGVNHMSDWTDSERSTVASGVVVKGVTAEQKKRMQKVSGNVKASLPATVDWRLHAPSVLTAVKDQGHCGSSWAMASIESLETAHAIGRRSLHALSVQQVLSCMPNKEHCGGKGGCSGGPIGPTMEYFYEGVSSEWLYSYSSYFGHDFECNKNATVAEVRPDGYNEVFPNHQDTTLQALSQTGPMAVTVDASGWHDYESGIFADCDYEKNITIGHAVQLVGYGHDSILKQDYWIIRNSWSPLYGEDGYIRLLRTDDPDCGTSTQWNTKGDGCDGDPDSIVACGMCGLLVEPKYPTFMIP